MAPQPTIYQNTTQKPLKQRHRLAWPLNIVARTKYSEPGTWPHGPPVATPLVDNGDDVNVTIQRYKYSVLW